MITYSRLKLSDLCTLSQSELLENHTLHNDTYIYSPYMAIPPPPPRGSCKGHYGFVFQVRDCDYP